jgi:hypothetical protein
MIKSFPNGEDIRLPPFVCTVAINCEFITLIEFIASGVLNP